MLQLCFACVDTSQISWLGPTKRLLLEEDQVVHSSDQQDLKEQEVHSLQLRKEECKEYVE
jgi:hypothetical protein